MSTNDERVDRRSAWAAAPLGVAMPVVIVIWAVFSWVFLTNPVRPYATGGVLEFDHCSTS